MPTVVRACRATWASLFKGCCSSTLSLRSGAKFLPQSTPTTCISRRSSSTPKEQSRERFVLDYLRHGPGSALLSTWRSLTISIVSVHKNPLRSRKRRRETQSQPQRKYVARTRHGRFAGVQRALAVRKSPHASRCHRSEKNCASVVLQIQRISRAHI